MPNFPNFKVPAMLNAAMLNYLNMNTFLPIDHLVSDYSTVGACK